MGFELPNGKTARNLQDQVKFLSEKLKDLYAAVNKIGIRVLVVDELPEEGASATIYLVPAEEASQENIYNEYMWIEDEWELIGSTAIDLSDYAQLSGNNVFTGNNTFNKADGIKIKGTNNNSSMWSITTADYLFYIKDSNNIDRIYFSWNDTVINTDVLRPKTNNSSDLGNRDYKWKDLYLSGSVNFDTNIKIFKDQYGGIMFQNNANNYPLQVYSNAVYVSQDLLTAASKDLGSSTYKWKDLYLSGVISDGTNSVSVAAISKTRLYRHRFQFTYTGGGGYLNVITNSATAISDTESDFQTAIDSAISVYVNQSDGSRALFLSASLSQNDCRWFTSSGTATGGSVSFGQESIAEIQ